MQWHFETTDEPEQTRLNLEKLSCVHKTWFQTRDVNILRQSKCFVGWFERANILLGSSSLVDRTPVTWSSGLDEQTRTAHLRGFTAGGQLIISAEPIQLSPNFTNSFAFHSNIQRFNPSQQYVQAVRLSGRKVAIVIDSDTKQAWLVPLLSLILHLCHRYFQEVKLDDEVDPIPFAELSTDGSHAVIKAIEKHGDLLVLGQDDTPDRETLRQLFLRINTNLLDTAGTREKPVKRHIFASELMGMIFEPGPGSALKKIEVSGGTGSWASLVEKVDFVGCCTNIGQLIEPVVQSQGCGCVTLPQEQFLLAAHMRCLEVLSQRAGSSVGKVREGACKFGEDMFWSAETPFWHDVCKERAHQSIWTDVLLRKQVLQQITPKQMIRYEAANARAATIPQKMASDGAVVFGDNVATPIRPVYQRKIFSKLRAVIPRYMVKDSKAHEIDQKHMSSTKEQTTSSSL